MRVSQKHQGASGLGAISFDTGDIAGSVVNAIMPAVRAQMPSLVDAAMPSIRAQMPSLMASAMPALQAQIPALMPAVVGQLPQLLDAALPTLYAKLPALTARITPLVRKEFDSALDQYAQTYLGPTARYKALAPALALAAMAMTLASSGIIIYSFWRGGSAVPNGQRKPRRTVVVI